MPDPTAASASFHVSSTASDACSSSTVTVDQTIELAALFEAHVNVVVLRRRSLHALGAYARKIAAGPAFTFKATASMASEEGLDALDELSAALPPDDARDVLVADIAYWVEVISQMTGSARVGIRLARLDTSMCPRFHIDPVTVRLVCAYAGAPSEWLDERDIDRSGIQGAWIPDAALRTRSVLRCAPLDVVLFKGSGWSGNEGRGAVHRSPAPGAPRLLLTVDPIG